MKQVFCYKVFTTVSEFITWQCEKERKIFQMQPVISGFGIVTDKNEPNTANADAGVTLFVVYVEEVE
jgi:hypothetical protein